MTAGLGKLVVEGLRDPAWGARTAMGFFTTWSLLFVLLGRWTHEYVNLLALSGAVAVGGFWLTHVAPRRFVVPFRGGVRVIQGRDAVVVDLLFHVVPFAVVCCLYWDYYSEHREVLSVLAIALAYCVVNPHLDRTYDTDIRPVLAACLVAVAACTTVRRDCLPNK